MIAPVPVHCFSITLISVHHIFCLVSIKSRLSTIAKKPVLKFVHSKLEYQKDHEGTVLKISNNTLIKLCGGADSLTSAFVFHKCKSDFLLSMFTCILLTLPSNVRLSYCCSVWKIEQKHHLVHLKKLHNENMN